MASHFAHIDTTIHPEDEMFLSAVKALPSVGLAKAVYLRQGFEINSTLQAVLDWVAHPDKSSAKVLDFACGYGRSTRFLVAEIPAANVWVSDIDEAAVEFQKAEFAVNGFVSSYEPRDVVCGERFDLIFVASLFTHLPRYRFEQWLRRLLGLLKDKGVLAISVHDSALSNGRPMPSDGFLFVPESESRSLDVNEYGSTYVSEAYVSGAVRSLFGGEVAYRRLPLALCGSHDMYLLSRRSVEEFDSFEFANPPVGYVDWFSLSEEGVFRIGGWAADHDPANEITSIRVFFDGIVVGEVKTGYEREDVAASLGVEGARFSGWDFWKKGVDREADGGKVVEVVVTSSSGRTTTLHSSEVRDASLPTLPVPQERVAWLAGSS
ncbi:MAG TPA: class I SAM-dependent methyltransferase [Ramlibacter sp.]|uniref:class I SAM-dependent methyltransferase n=1 Tax=Ramlibacter sp. TaxID=1917967 RepID=UPI002B82EB93|nr:class I SAM-dependent methyltransferase [Ramlibacter sp.]HVZ44414.1 class I SAM-dependent methyltransferase [Ramlibacter sp.]